MWTKICGITDVETARWVLECGPSAIGLNFFPSSKRYVSPEVAAEISQMTPRHIETVGLFVNAAPSQISRVVRECGLTTIQIHGNESEEDLAEIQLLCPDTLLIRAFRCGPDDVFDVVNYLEICRNLGIHVDRCLLDAAVPGEYGGTGHQAPWQTIASEFDDPDAPPLILAGGLTAENVAQGIAKTKPWGVDVASGVETADGQKDRTLVQQFLDAVRECESST